MDTSITENNDKLFLIVQRKYHQNVKKKLLPLIWLK